MFVAAARVPAIRKEDTTKRFASGWGASQHEAYENCAKEFAERLSAQFFGDEQIRRCALDDLHGSGVLPPDIMLMGDGQPAQTGSPPEAESMTENLAQWQPGVAIDWVRATSPLSMSDCWLPAGLCYLGHATDRGAGLAPATTNGVAAGASIDDAAIRAFVELVERDAVAIWWYNRLARPRLAPSSTGDRLIAAYDLWAGRRGRPLALYDLSHDCDVPVVAAVTHDGDGRHIALGFGAGATTAAAARHAVGELAQFECNVALIEGYVRARGELDLSPEAAALQRWWRNAAIDDCPHLGGDLVEQPRPDPPKLTLDACHACCARLGLSFLALDLTRPHVGTPVVRVIVPGMRPTQPRFAPGRLYDVPVRLGWLHRARARSELNPTPMVF